MAARGSGAGARRDPRRRRRCGGRQPPPGARPLSAPLPAELAAAAGDHAVRAWTTTLPATIAELARRWSLDVGLAFEPGGSSSWTAPARTRDGRVVVLKVGRRHYEADHEADGLRVWKGRGTVRLLAADRPDGATEALLLEACEPGTSASSLPEADQDVVVATMLRVLWIPPPVDGPFRPLSSMADAWAAGLDVARAETLVGDPGMIRAGLDLFRELARTADGRPVLLITDLHAGNVLAARRQPWLVIDPKPYIGDRTYDPLQHMLNCPQRLTTTPRPFVDRIAGLLDLDRPRLTQWLFARCVLGCCEQPELAAVARTLAPA